MKNIRKALLTVTTLVLAVQIASLSKASAASGDKCATSSPAPASVPLYTPSAAQCSSLQTDLDEYEATLNKFVSEKIISSQLANQLISVAQSFVNKECPTSAATYECSVQTANGAEVIGTNSTGGLVDTVTDYKTVCMTQNACKNIVSEAFTVLSATSSAACSQSGNTTVIQMTDLQVQAQVNVIVNP
jgi:hypothetical protein